MTSHMTDTVLGPDGRPISYAYETITAEANGLVVQGERQQEYGHPLPWGEHCAAVWQALFGWDVDAEKVSLAMIAFKLVRQINAAKRDNLTDIAGYAEVANRIVEARKALRRAEDEEPR